MMTAGFMPGALAKNIPPGVNDPAITPCGVVLHVAVSESDSLHDFFNGPSGGVESHFYVRRSGVIEQYRSIWFQADAQLDGNTFTLDGKSVGFVSVETQGMGAGEWTNEQLSSIKAIILWVRSQADFPLAPCPAWNKPGVGYHTMWGSPSHWTPSRKTCPGPDRIEQFHDVIEPWMVEASKPRLWRIQHRIVTANMYVNNPASDARVSGPLAGMHQIITRVKSAFRFTPDVIAVQEGHRMLAALEEVAGYNLIDDRSDGEASKEIPALVVDPYRVTGTEYHHAADGTGSDAFDHERGIKVTKYVKRARKVAVVNTHMGLIADELALEGGTKRIGAAAAEHAAHAQKVARTYLRLKANGYLVFVTADANAHGIWSQSLPAVLQAAGMQVTQHGVDLIAHDPSLVRVKQATTVGHRLTGSDKHDAIAVRYIEKRKP